VVGIVDTGPESPYPVVTAEKAIGSAHRPHEINRRVGLASRRLAETHGVSVGYIGDLGSGDGSQSDVGETEESAIGRHPDFACDSENSPGPVVPIQAARYRSRG
jgi:hypothetical protein